uniref:NADH-ubiquinone oxidoreductase chain 5 n=1 Tax=Tamarixia radiata TaxID=459345 RepID=A0A6B9UEH0_9HYME|nr:NADH dehydrogenase subunit 5 [Tamarixia radiata]
MLLYYLSSLMFLLLSMMMFYFSIIFMINKLHIFFEWNFIMMNSVNMNMYMYIDWMTLMFMFTVLLISSMIMLYCIEYMSHDNNNIRFFWILLFFIISMLFMIISPNILTILIGWDGLGLTSFCLIIFYQNKNSMNSGMLTLLINRLGDIFIIMGISLMLMFGTWSFLNYNNLIYLIIMLITLASFTKSAQFPFSSWLPAAMAAPTPVSSLVHSSTLVTAGIYLLIRFNNILINYSNWTKYMMLTGLMTMLMAGMSANFEFDLKKIIAYSTLSQLGLMMMILSMKLFNLAYFHLITHAMFKSMLFMCSGVMIHSMNNIQDIRYMGMLNKFMPMTTMMFLIANYSLCGMPFFSGFYSKDLILESLFNMKINYMIYILLILSTSLTVIYSFRLMYYLMMKDFKFYSMNMIKEVKIMNYSMLILMILSISFGMGLNWLIYNNIENNFLMKFEKMLILMICILGFMLNLFLIYNISFIKNLYFSNFFLGKMWFMYKFNLLMIYNLLKFGKFYSLMFDKGWSEEVYKNYFMNLNNNIIKFNMLKFNMLINLIYIMLIIIVSVSMLY